MFPGLVVAFIVVPIVEIYALIRVGSWIGVWWTVALLLADGLAGAWLLKREGRKTWAAFNDAMRAGRFPGKEVADGALVIVGGTLLLTPGFVTDIVGALFLLPPTRAIARRLLMRVAKSRYGILGVLGDLPTRTPPFADEGVIDGSVVDGSVVDGETVRRRDEPPSPGLRR